MHSRKKYLNADFEQLKMYTKNNVNYDISFSLNPS